MRSRASLPIGAEPSLAMSKNLRRRWAQQKASVIALPHAVSAIVVPKLLADQGGEAVGAAAEVHRLGGHQHPHSRRNGDHVADLMARSTVVKVAVSTPRRSRTVAAPITISITGEPPSRTTDVSAHGGAASTITGAKAEPLSAVSLSDRPRAAQRQPNNCCAVNPRRGAGEQTR
jgi:hypothetical protein